MLYYFKIVTYLGCSCYLSDFHSVVLKEYKTNYLCEIRFNFKTFVEYENDFLSLIESRCFDLTQTVLWDSFVIVVYWICTACFKQIQFYVNFYPFCLCIILIKCWRWQYDASHYLILNLTGCRYCMRLSDVSHTQTCKSNLLCAQSRSIMQWFDGPSKDMNNIHLAIILNLGHTF